VIGIYEPLVLAWEGGNRETSQAAEPHLFPTTQTCYHGACFEPHALDPCPGNHRYVAAVHPDASRPLEP
jgi:hypothetical protein